MNHQPVNSYPFGSREARGYERYACAVVKEHAVDNPGIAIGDQRKC